VGGGWHAGRGISTDVKTPAAYFQALQQLLQRGIPPIASLETARRYAYTVFFRSSLPIRHYQAMDTGMTELCLDSLHDLQPGHDPTNDTICRGVLLDEPFENP
jgi:hypothetical protein